MDAYEILKKENCTCVLTNGKAVFKSNLRGVKPLLDFICSKENFENFSAADKVVGKGAALLYVLMKVKFVHAVVLSEYSKEVFEKNNIEYKYDNLVPAIINRSGDGYCPIETAVKNISDPQTAFNVITKALDKIKK